MYYLIVRHRISICDLVYGFAETYVELIPIINRAIESYGNIEMDIKRW